MMLKLNVSHQGFNPNWHEPARTRRLCNYGPSSVLQLVSFLTGIANMGWQWMCGLWCLYALMVPCVHLTVQCSCRVTVWPCWKKIRSGANMCSQGCNGHMVLDCLKGDFSGQTHHRIVGFWMNYIITGYKASNMWPARSWEQNSSLYVDDFW